ncbi:MAG: hypothetical protein KGL39_03390 [Patescibacteria group bacterium]|nr:hypothetical protein [Patescibacteria group bacterium]
MNQDHMIGGALGAAVATYLPPVLTYYQGAAAPVAAETNLLILAGVAVYGVVRWAINRPRKGAAVGSVVAPAPAPMAVPPASPPAVQAQL